MKVLISRGLYGNHLGGAETEIIDFIQLLTDEGVDALLVSNSKELFDKSNKISTNIRINWPRSEVRFVRALITPTKYILFAWQLLSVARKFSPDVVISESKEDGIVLSKYRKVHGAAVVWRDHADLRHHLKKNRGNIFAKIYQSFLISALEKTDVIATVSSFDVKHIENFVGREIPKKTVIHPGTILDSKTKVVKNSQKDRVTIGTVARLVEDKGVQYLIKAVASLPKSTYKLVIVGDGEYKESLKDLCKKNYVDCEFAGYTPQPEKHYESFDIFVQPSKYEGWSKTVIEAMAAGLPVVASNIPCHAEQIIDGQTGVLFSSGDSADLSSKLAELINNTKLRTSIGKEAAKSARNFGDFKEIFYNQFFPLLKNLSK